MKLGFFEHLSEQFQLPLTNPVLVFSLILFIILLAPLILRKLRAPGIVGLILSGVLIGPYGLHLLEKNSAIELFSTIGLLYLMFIAGLDLDLREFLRHRNKSITFGLLTFIIPLVVGFAICYHVLGYGYLASLLTASMFSTHTLVAFPIITRYGLSKELSVAITIGGTILTDTAVLLLLAVIIGMNNSQLTPGFFIQLSSSLLIFGAIMFGVIPRIAKWFFTRLESEKTSHYIFVLSIVFLAAFLAEVAGVEPIIGAFLAGLALNRLIPHTSPLMNRLEFVGNALFIPFFLISVGMLVDVSVLLNGPMAWVIAITLSVVALAGKWLAALASQLLFKFSSTQRQIIFGLSSSHAAATIAVITVGYNLQIIDENILNGTIILILITCLVASFATERAAKKMIVENENPNATIANNHLHEESILIPVANFANLEKLIDVTTLLKDRKSPFPVHLLSVVNNDPTAEINLANCRRRLDESVKYASASELSFKPIATVDYNISHAIIRISREVSANTIVMGWPGKETLLDRFFGHKTDNIIENFEKNIILCNLKKPLNTFSLIKLICPPFSETGKGFSFWMLKVMQIARELMLPVEFYCTNTTREAIMNFIKMKKLNGKVSFTELNDLDEFLPLSNQVEENELFIVVSARKGSLSYQREMDFIHKKLNRSGIEITTLLIYPMKDTTNSGYSETHSSLLASEQ